MYSNSLEKSSVNCKTKSVLKIKCYVERDQKATKAAAVDLVCVEDQENLHLMDPRESTAPRDLKDQSV